MVIINSLDVDEISNEDLRLLKLIISDERYQKSECFHFAEDSKRCICAEALLQYSLFQFSGQFIKVDKIHNKYGKPMLIFPNGFLYNISHSGKWVAIAYANTEVGIDIEKIQKADEGIVKKFFSDDERSSLEKLTKEEKGQRFTQIWTLKESYIKYLGVGLSKNLSSFSIDPLRGQVYDSEGTMNDDIIFHSFQYEQLYYLSVCSTERVEKINKVDNNVFMEFAMRYEIHKNEDRPRR